MRERTSSMFVSRGLAEWQVFMNQHECVGEWLENRPFGTKSQYGRKLMHFCETMEISPAQFQNLTRHQARDAVWKFIKPFIKASPSKAKNFMAALKSFYRNKDGEVLPFDSRRGGKHYFNAKRRKKAAREHVPDKPEMYRIIDAARNLRDKTVLLFLFQSGIRENALCHLRFKHVSRQLYADPQPKIPLRLRITEQVDWKLRGYNIDFYDTFLQGEAVQELKAWCDTYHKDKDPEKPLFFTLLGNPLKGERVWSIVKGCVRRAGLDETTIWVHTIRRAFRRVVRNTGLDDEFKEAIMGHVLPDSRENYFSRNDPSDIENAYMQIDFSREVPETKTQRQAKQIEDLTRQVEGLKALVEMPSYTLPDSLDEKQKIDALTKIMATIQKELEKLKRKG